MEAIYEPQMTRLLELVLRPTDVFVDGGANEGYFSILAASLVGNGQVHCVEPQSRLQPILRENIRLNSARSVTIHSVALCEHPGEVKLFLCSSMLFEELQYHLHLYRIARSVFYFLVMLFSENQNKQRR